MLAGRRILLGVSGGIAAYKAAELARRLVKEHAQVQALLTRNASRFVSPLTFRTLTGRPVATRLFSDPHSPVPHIALAKWPELILVAPATADCLARAAAGRANDLLSAVLLDTEAPILWAPAMNTRMWSHPLTREHVRRLREIGQHFVEPEPGELACGESGSGRLAGLEAILSSTRALLAPRSALAGRRVVITAGPTREPWDAVRYLSNRSSGKMGYALALAARQRGAEVVLISGPVSLPKPEGIRVIPVTTALEMHAAALEEFPKAKAAIAAAAVADFRPARAVAGKIKKNGENPPVLELAPNPDILLEWGKRKQPGQILVGFAAESSRALEHAAAKRAAKHCDLMVVNAAGGPEDAFEAEESRVYLLDSGDRAEELPRQPKSRTAEMILDRIEKMFGPDEK